MICTSFCAEDVDLSSEPGWNAEGMDATCEICDFLTCCDGVNSYDSCKASLPTDILATMNPASGTGTGTTAPAETTSGTVTNDTGYNDWLDNIAGNDIHDGMNHTDNGTATDTWFTDQEGTEWADVASDDVPTEEVPSDDVPSAASRIVSASVIAAYTAFAIIFL